MIKLYYSPKTRATRPRWLLEELGVPYELVMVDMAQKKHKEPEYLKIHPLGQVPALEIDGKVMLESGAMVTYLADKYASKKKLAPGIDDPERASYLQWIFFATSTLETPIIQTFLHTVKRPEAKRVAFLVEECRADLVPMAAMVEAQLEESEYLLPSGFSAADLLMASLFLFAQRLGMMPPAPKIAAYVTKVTSRPAYLKAIS